MINKILGAMINYNSPDVKRINHAIKVYNFAGYIAINEDCSPQTQEIIEIAAIMHDIGIHEAEKKYNSSAGAYQEKEGPEIARTLLSKYDIPKKVMERVLFLIGNHHSYGKIDNQDFQILVEADFLVNIYEESMKKEAVDSIKRKIFKTESGTALLEKMYLN